MKPKTIRWVDSWIGKPGCFALSVLQRLSHIFRRPLPPTAPVRKILFIKLVEQGATVLAYSAFRRALDMVGRDNVYMVVFKENRAILDVLGVFPPENILVIDASNFFRFFRDSIKVCLKTRQVGIDTTVDMEFFARASGIFAVLTGARRRVGLHSFTSETPYRGDLMTHRVQYSPYIHTAKYLELLVEALERPFEETPMLKVPLGPTKHAVPKLIPTEEDIERVRGILEANGCDPDSRIVLLNPNASDLVEIRKWPMERFCDLAHAILECDPGLTIVITGAPSEADNARVVTESVKSPRCVSVAGSTTLRDLVVLYTMSEALVTNDSGPAHFAALTDIDVFVMFGPETPKLWAPIGSNVHVITKDLTCSPCVSVFNFRFSPCTDPVCIKTISVQDILDALIPCLDARRQVIAQPTGTPAP